MFIRRFMQIQNLTLLLPQQIIIDVDLNFLQRQQHKDFVDHCQHQFRNQGLDLEKMPQIKP
jgi:hypothetical protein